MANLSQFFILIHEGLRYDDKIGQIVDNLTGIKRQNGLLALVANRENERE